MKKTFLAAVMVAGLGASTAALAEDTRPLGAISEYHGQVALMQTRQDVYNELAGNIRHAAPKPIRTGADRSEARNDGQSLFAQQARKSAAFGG